MKLTFNNETVTANTNINDTCIADFDNEIEFTNFSIVMANNYLYFNTNYNTQFLFINLRDYDQSINIDKQIQNILDINTVLIITSLKDEIDSEYKRREMYLKHIEECKAEFNKQYEKIIAFL